MNNDYLSKPQNPPLAGGGAGVVLIHEFWGVNNQIKKVADRLANEGFCALAVDLYDGKITANADEARKMKDAVLAHPEKALARVSEAINKLTKEGISKEKIAVWGFCFGGSISFKSAVADLGVGAYIIFYGSLITDDKSVLSKIQKPILAVFGGLDKSIPIALVESMEKNLDALGKINEVYIYPEADHAFFNKEQPRYSASASADVWPKALAFLRKNLTA